MAQRPRPMLSVEPEPRAFFTKPKPRKRPTSTPKWVVHATDHGADDAVARAIEALVTLAAGAGCRAWPLIYPISLNNAFAHVPGKGRVKTREYRHWIKAQMGALLQAGPRHLTGGPVDILLRPPASGADTDNVEKAYLDAFTAMRLIEDDAMVRCVLVHPIPGVEEGVGYVLPIPLTTGAPAP